MSALQSLQGTHSVATFVALVHVGLLLMNYQGSTKFNAGNALRAFIMVSLGIPWTLEESNISKTSESASLLMRWSATCATTQDTPMTWMQQRWCISLIWRRNGNWLNHHLSLPPPIAIFVLVIFRFANSRLQSLYKLSI